MTTHRTSCFRSRCSPSRSRPRSLFASGHTSRLRACGTPRRTDPRQSVSRECRAALAARQPTVLVSRRPGGQPDDNSCSSTPRPARNSPAFDHPRLAEALAKATEQPCDAQRLPFDWIKIDEPSNAVLFRAHDKGWSCSLESYAISPADVETPPERRDRRGRGNRSRHSLTPTPTRPTANGPW